MIKYLFLLLSLLLMTSCSSTGYNPGYIISDTSAEPSEQPLESSSHQAP